MLATVTGEPTAACAVGGVAPLPCFGVSVPFAFCAAGTFKGVGLPVISDMHAVYHKSTIRTEPGQ